MEKVLYLNWEIYNNSLDSEERYCHNCGKKVIFIDSLKRRQNANGKNIFHYAIYKCPNNHTWNKMLNTFKAISGLNNLDGEVYKRESKIDMIFIEDLIAKGFNYVEITIDVIDEKIRLDKLVSNQILDLSRSKIEEGIKKGFILINEKLVKPKTIVREKETISLELNKFKLVE
ncbi:MULTISPECIES: S4 domain-containing protein [unclassified Clostridium]|uniref:S4 domain-containing protein n=1 Tax=unclassified Clostridium TaxID=2614128 RepID=UPI0025C5A093|nr:MULTISPECIES: S4 domain-containing protein [unclassified Clostridium]